MKILLACILLNIVPASIPCPGLAPPPPSGVVRPFGPTGRWSGHWGVDVSTALGSPVRTIGSGRVTFVGVVVSNRTVTVDHGGGLATSYSYLGATTVRPGAAVGRGSSIGTAALHEGREAFHLSVRIGGTYVDPMLLWRCSTDLSHALYLASPNVL